jgi:hypothetical protein
MLTKKVSDRLRGSLPQYTKVTGSALWQAGLRHFAGFVL